MKSHLKLEHSRAESNRKPVLPRWATGLGSNVLQGPRGGGSPRLRDAA